MKNAWIIFLLVTFFCVLQTSFFPPLFILLSKTTGFSFFSNQTVNLVFQVLLYLSLKRDLSGTLIWAILFGILCGSFGLSWSSVLPLSFLTVAVICSIFRRHVLLSDEISMAIFAAIAFLLEGLVHLGIGQYLNQLPNAFTGQIGSLFFQTILNALFFPITFWLLHWIDARTLEADIRSRRNLIYDF